MVLKAGFLFTKVLVLQVKNRESCGCVSSLGVGVAGWGAWGLQCESLDLDLPVQLVSRAALPAPRLLTRKLGTVAVLTSWGAAKAARGAVHRSAELIAYACVNAHRRCLLGFKKRSD